jgi:hypothetical protein
MAYASGLGLLIGNGNRLLRSCAMNQLDIGGQRIAYRESGIGPPLVLLHGWPLSWTGASSQGSLMACPTSSGLWHGTRQAQADRPTRPRRPGSRTGRTGLPRSSRPSSLPRPTWLGSRSAGAWRSSCSASFRTSSDR